MSAAPIEHDFNDWQDGYDDGRNARPAEPGARDRLSYIAGYIEGEARAIIEADAAMPRGQEPNA